MGRKGCRIWGWVCRREVGRDKGGFWEIVVLELSDWVAVKGRKVMQGLRWSI